MAVNESRIEAARRRLRIARYSIGAVAAAAFALFGFAVRDAHPATHDSGSQATTSDVFSEDSTLQDDSSFGFDGGGSIGSADSSSAPSVQSGGS
jgi:hypothetical protein